MSDFEHYLDVYAEIIVKVGLNIQDEQRLLIGMPFFDIHGAQIELAPLIRKITKHAYQSGAKLVDVMWNDEELELIRHKYAPRDSFDTFPTWRTDGALEIANSGDAVLIFAATSPELLKDQNSDLINQYFVRVLEHTKPILNKRITNDFTLSIAAAPIKSWSDKVFQDIPSKERLNYAWDIIFKMCRVYESDPINAWKEHRVSLIKRADYLSQKAYRGLKLTGPDTDLFVGLAEGHIWKAASATHKRGFNFIPNIPTEEVFTSPHKDLTEGIVKTTKPLSHYGSLIEDIVLTFSAGKIIKATAKKGETSLKNILKTDEGILRLGEIALVPHSSPISQMNRLFYNILIDENASNHIAIGQAYKFSVQGGEKMTDKEFAEVGGNSSLDHLDLMIGSEEMNVDGLTKDGKTEQIMKNGEWSFNI